MMLRYYQEEAVAALLTFREQHPGGNPIVALPTGAGKSLVIASFFANVFAYFADTRALMLTHVKTLIEQNHAALLRAWPWAPVGIYSAGLNKREAARPITFAGIQSVYQKADLFGHIDVVAIDECHLVSPKAHTMYASFLRALRLINPALMVLGFTATPHRSDSGSLIGPGSLFTHVCYDRTQRSAFMQLVTDGYLCRLSVKRTATKIDTSKVKIQGEDFNLAALGESVLADFPNVQNCVAETILEGAGRAHWLLFTVNIAHAVAVHTLLVSAGVSAGVYHSEQKGAENARALADFKAGKVQALVNVNCLTTGVDVPMIDVIAVMRPTRSPVLWVQMLGRGLRPHASKKDCLVLDFGHCAEVLGPINDPVIRGPKTLTEDCDSCAHYRTLREADGLLRHRECPECGKSFAAPMIACPTCDYYNYAGCLHCVQCGHKFECQRDPHGTAADVPVMAEAHAPATVEKAEGRLLTVLGVDYVLHVKDAHEGLRVTYWTHEGERVNRYVCLGHEEGAWPRMQAEKFWREHRPPGSPFWAPPAAEILVRYKRSLRVPKTITVQEKKGFSNVISQQFE